MTITAARVEVLTAEVRVLMVGSRQVTLSVHAQLDQVKPGEIDPFGRVAPRDSEHGQVYVVGASRREADRATLVRSSDQRADEHRRLASYYRCMVPVAAERERAERELEQVGPLPQDRWPLENRLSALRRDLDGLRDWSPAELEEEAVMHENLTGQAARWEALPLIVLAGLR
jgi:hypothetical protein